MALETEVKVRIYPDHNALTTHAKGYVRIASMSGNDRFKTKTIHLDVYSTEVDRGKTDFDEADKTKWAYKKPIYQMVFTVNSLDYENAAYDFSTVEGVYKYLKTKKIFENTPVEIDLTAAKDV